MIATLFPHTDAPQRATPAVRLAAREGGDSGSALSQRIAALERQVADQAQAIQSLLRERQSLEAARNGCWRKRRALLHIDGHL